MTVTDCGTSRSGVSNFAPVLARELSRSRAPEALISGRVASGAEAAGSEGEGEGGGAQAQRDGRRRGVGGAGHARGLLLSFWMERRGGGWDAGFRE